MKSSDLRRGGRPGQEAADVTRSAAPAIAHQEDPNEVLQIPGGEISISLPWMWTGRYRKHKLFTSLSPRQGAALRAIFDGLELAESRKPGGTPIRNQDDAARAFLEKVADRLGIDAHGQRGN